ncbi:MAG: bifunctional nuclease family protein [bacterium]|nr:bifunctional nuclease family protein [bacterium]
MLIPMKVTGITIDPFTNMPIVILKDFEEKNAVPIWIGLVEASAIASELEGIHTPRPMTHDLLRDILGQLNIKISRIAVMDLRDNTYFATIFLQDGTTEIEIDSRPSDAIALALRTGSTILVDDKVISKSRQIELSTNQDEDEGKKRQKWLNLLENLTPEDFGKYKM